MSDYFIFTPKMDMNTLSNTLYKDHSLFYSKEPPKTPEVYVTFPDTSDLERGMMARISVDLWMPLPNPDIVVTVQSPQSELRVLRLSVSAVGDNFSFLVRLSVKYNKKFSECYHVFNLKVNIFLLNLFKGTFVFDSVFFLRFDNQYQILILNFSITLEFQVGLKTKILPLHFI